MAIPDPEPGLVVHFNYLWGREHEAGRQEARYARPCAVVLAHHLDEGCALRVLLAPITHAQPRPDQAAIEMPDRVKRHLGLDDQRSWIVLDELNETAWPGYDLQPNARGEYVYGFIPPKLYRQVKDGILAALRSSALRRVPRGR